MPILSQYWFQNQFFGGPFHVWNEPVPARRSISITGVPPMSGPQASSAATLVWQRADDEVVLDLPASINGNAGALLAIDGLLGENTTRTSPVYGAGIPWGPRVPYYGNDPNRHAPWDMIVRVYFDFHITTPGYCWDLDGNISYYLLLYLDRTGLLHGYVDAWGWEHGWKAADACRGEVHRRLNEGVDKGVPTVQALLDAAIAMNASGRFAQLYLLPGSGTRAPGASSENADTGIALALRPRLSLGQLITAGIVGAKLEELEPIE